MNVKHIAHAVLAAVLFAERNTNNAESDDTSLESEGYDVACFAPDTWDALRAELVPFLWANRRDLAASGLSDERIGHNFYFTSAGHGCGFWDEGLDDIGTRLTDACGRKEWSVYSDESEQLHIN